MKICEKRNALAALVAWVLILAASAGALAQEGAVPFDSGRWSIVSGQIVDYLGRKALIGSAYVKDIKLKDGVIDVDIAVDGRNAYPSILFRMTEGNSYEHVYIRPHQLGGPMNAIQYAPSNNGIGGWQLWNGDGYTNSLDMAKNEWVHLRLEFKGRQARFFVGEDSTPDLVIDDLKREPVEGLIGLMNANATTAYFSNFSYRSGENLVFEEPPAIDAPPGVVAAWKISQSMKLARVDMDRYPDSAFLQSLAWRDIEGDAAGLVDVSRTYGRAPGGADVIFAKTILAADRDIAKQFIFGYSDVVSIFCNGEIIFQGQSAYRQRDPTFQGIVGLYDAVWLPLKKGDNELMIAVAEAFGGWGFMFRDAKAEFHAPSVTELWRTGAEFLVPETAVWDPARKRVYVSNFDQARLSPGGAQSISVLTPDGGVESLAWVKGIAQPTGMAIRKDRLYVVERAGVAEIDIPKAAIVNRWPCPQPGLLNDIVIDGAGAMYISDSQRNAIFKLSKGKYEEWLSGDAIQRPNALCIDGRELLVGSSGDRCLKAIDLESKAVRIVKRLPPGIIDGIAVEPKGGYLVSLNEGRLYRISQDGSIEKLVDTSVPGICSADFGYDVKLGIVFIPTFTDNRVVAVKVGR